jgi:hypothetical protein
MKRIAILAMMALAFTLCPSHSRGDSKCDDSHKIPCDVTLGKPRVWGYARLYPLLDGLFQDVNSTQLTQLMLNPNTANAAGLDAVQNAFQAGVSFSQTLGANSALAQQLNSVLTTNASLQNELLSRQTQLVQAALTAQQQVGSAQALVDQLKLSNASGPQLLAANQALTAATDNLTAINNQLTLVKSQVAANLGSPQTLQPPSTSPQPSPPTLPSALLNLTAPPNAPANPSFPSSKQMDNQINLLWERLARLTSTLAQPDSLKNYAIDLVEINVGAMPLGRKKKLLGVEYSISCDEHTLVPRGSGPLVLDLFPSASTVNIVDTKYRENRIGLAAVLSWFTVGINAAYNRDHLRMTQTLGQSGYITGYGVGQPNFGWVFGRNLGDDTLTPGERTVFALVALPPTCKKLTVTANKAGWFQTQSNGWYNDEARRLNISGDDYCASTGEIFDSSRCKGQPTTAENHIKEINYAPADFDPTAPGKSLVSLEIETTQPIDSQQIININGRIIKRSRDSFGRGVNSAGSGGLLETASVDPNSWLPTGSSRFTLTLDPSAFGHSFPDIEIDSPSIDSLSGELTVKKALKPKKRNDGSENVDAATVKIAGREFICSDTCIADLPALGYPKSTVKQLLLSQRRYRNSGRETLLVTLAGDQPANAQGPTSGNGVPTLQVLSANDQSTWGGSSVVLASFLETTASGGSRDVTYRLKCEQLGSRLVCDPPTSRGFPQVFTIQVLDPDHSGGPITGTQGYNCQLPSDLRDRRLALQQLGSPNSCYRPLVWRVGQPEWRPVDGHPKQRELRVHLELDNVPDGQSVALLGDGVPPVAAAQCHFGSKETCGVDLLIPEKEFSNVTDQMVLQFVNLLEFVDLGGHEYSPTASLGFLHMNAQPLVTGTNNDQTLITGQNLVFANLRVGESGLPIPLECHPNGSVCVIRPEKPPNNAGTANNPPAAKAKDPFNGAEGFLFFTDDNVVLPVLQVKAGVITPISHTKPAAGGGGAGATPVPTISNNIVIETRPEIPKMFVAQ